MRDIRGMVCHMSGIWLWMQGGGGVDVDCALSILVSYWTYDACVRLLAAAGIAIAALWDARHGM